MRQEQLMDIHVLVKRIGSLFHELSDISAQLAEAIDRQDEVSMKMIVAMRYEPIEKLTVADRALREQLAQLGDGEDHDRIRAILNGDEAAASGESEKAIAAQAASNLRLRDKVMEQDKILNRKIARDKSIYQ